MRRAAASCSSSETQFAHTDSRSVRRHNDSCFTYPTVTSAAVNAASRPPRSAVAARGNGPGVSGRRLRVADPAKLRWVASRRHSPELERAACVHLFRRRARSLHPAIASIRAADDRWRKGGGIEGASRPWMDARARKSRAPHLVVGAADAHPLSSLPSCLCVSGAGVARGGCGRLASARRSIRRSSRSRFQPARWSSWRWSWWSRSCTSSLMRLTLHRFGGRVREMGLTTVALVPSFYCDITDSYLLPRKRQRIAVALAGPFAQAVVGALASIWLCLAPPSHRGAALCAWSATAVVGLLSIANLFPFARTDGYYVLTELLDLPNLRRLARRSTEELVDRRATRARRGRGVSTWAFWLYGVPSTAFARVDGGSPRSSAGASVACRWSSDCLIAASLPRDGWSGERARSSISKVVPLAGAVIVGRRRDDRSRYRIGDFRYARRVRRCRFRATGRRWTFRPPQPEPPRPLPLAPCRRPRAVDLGVVRLTPGRVVEGVVRGRAASAGGGRRSPGPSKRNCRSCLRRDARSRMRRAASSCPTRRCACDRWRSARPGLRIRCRLGFEATGRSIVAAASKERVIAEDGSPVPGAIVQVGDRQTTTDERGQFRLLTLTPGDAVLLARTPTGSMSDRHEWWSWLDRSERSRFGLASPRRLPVASPISSPVAPWPERSFTSTRERRSRSAPRRCRSPASSDGNGRFTLERHAAGSVHRRGGATRLHPIGQARGPASPLAQTPRSRYRSCRKRASPGASSTIAVSQLRARRSSRFIRIRSNKSRRVAARRPGADQHGRQRRDGSIRPSRSRGWTRPATGSDGAGVRAARASEASMSKPAPSAATSSSRFAAVFHWSDSSSTLAIGRSPAPPFAMRGSKRRPACRFSCRCRSARRLRPTPMRMANSSSLVSRLAATTSGSRPPATRSVYLRGRQIWPSSASALPENRACPRASRSAGHVLTLAGEPAVGARVIGRRSHARHSRDDDRCGRRVCRGRSVGRPAGLAAVRRSPAFPR